MKHGIALIPEQREIKILIALKVRLFNKKPSILGFHNIKS